MASFKFGLEMITGLLNKSLHKCQTQFLLIKDIIFMIIRFLITMKVEL